MKKLKDRPHIKLGQFIARRRDSLGWTQERLADESGVTLTVIKDMERGVKEGRLDTRRAIVKALGCSLSDLYLEATEVLATRKAPFPSREFFETLIENPNEATLVQVQRLIQQLAEVGETRRALALGILFSSFEIAEPYIPADSPKLIALLKAL